MSEGLTADFVILADSAQVQGDKLYLLGGGWSVVLAKEFPVQHQMAVAAGILVPWLETNARHSFRVVLHAEDGSVFTDVGGEFEQGRPPGLAPGSTQRVMFTVNMGIRIDAPTEAVAELWIDGALARSVPFRVAGGAPALGSI